MILVVGSGFPLALIWEGYPVILLSILAAGSYPNSSSHPG